MSIIVLLLRHPSHAGVFWRLHVAYGFPTQEKVVALTYDDGPHPVFTPALLHVLDQYRVKATFFMIGQEMERHPAIVREVIARGHVIGNHTYTHPHDISGERSEQVIRELDRCEEVIERFTGKRTHLFRPPRGLLNDSVDTIAGEEGYQTILWTISADHHDAPTPELMAKRVVDHIHPGAIILAHDGQFATRCRDVEATPLIITALRARGYRFVTIPELQALTRARPSKNPLPIFHMLHLWNYVINR